MSEMDKTPASDDANVVSLRRKEHMKKRLNELLPPDNEEAVRAHRTYAEYVGINLYQLDTLILCAKERQDRSGSAASHKRVQALLDLSFSLSTDLQERFATLKEMFLMGAKQDSQGGENGACE